MANMAGYFGVFFAAFICIQAAVPSSRNDGIQNMLSSESLENVDRPCDEADICELPNESGPCEAAFERYYYDIKTRRCKPFTWGGCGGNGNNFIKMDECMEKCGVEIEPGKNVCELPYRTGPCQGNIQRYYYDVESNTCKQFTYGGCKGNFNNFYSEEECLEMCKDYEPQPKEDVCGLPFKTGPCRAAFPRFYYNNDTGTCEKFIYGGCRSNGNNFETKEECLEKCEAKGSSQVVEFHCEETGRFVHPHSCDSYIECLEDEDEIVGRVVQCPTGQHFNMNTKNCDDSCIVECDEDFDCTCQWPHCLITCEKPNGRFPLPTNCRLYVECKNNLPMIYQCPEGKAFDIETEDCVPIQETSCRPARASNDILSIMRNGQ